MNDEGEDFDYQEYSSRKLVFILVGVFVLFVLFLIDILFSSRFLNPLELLTGLFNPSAVDEMVRIIVWDIKLPVTTISIVAGAIFGFAGAVMQTMLNNPLASPYTLGISAGASFGAAIAMVTGISAIAGFGMYLIPCFAFVFALLACAGIFLIAKMSGFSAGILVLAGIGLIFFFQAGSTILQYIASAESLQNLVFWTMGNVNGANWTQIVIMLVVFLIFFVIIYKNSWKLTSLKLGDEKAKSLGVDVKRLRKWLFVMISILTATSVAFVGCIGFIGIIGPHIARMTIGEDQRFFLPFSAILGAVILVFADFGSKFIIESSVIPIGAITAVVGVPFYFYLISKRRKKLIS